MITPSLLIQSYVHADEVKYVTEYKYVTAITEPNK